MPFPVTGPKGPRPSGGLAPPSPQETKIQPIPPPMGGINAVDGLLTMEGRSPEDSIFQYNLIPSQYGVRVRSGTEEWCTHVGTNGVRTLIPYTGSTSSVSRLFAAASDAIYNVTTSSAAPSSSIAFVTSDSTSGYGQWANFTTLAGFFCLYTDETNGYYVYTEGAGTWAKVASGGGAIQVSGVDPALLVDVVVFKNRAWFIERGSSRAWYLNTGAVFGAATAFNFGNKFRHGGVLVALFTWTLDGGDGADDILVAVSSAGDVILYKGGDPTNSSDFSQVGQWYIGPPPAGRRIGGAFGGELYLLSTYGITPLSKLISGMKVQEAATQLSRKINPLINTQMLQARSSLGWEIKLLSQENILLCSVPAQTGLDKIQFVQSLNTQGWAVYRSIPYYTGETWDGDFYIATADNRVLLHTGSQDEIALGATTGTAISWSTLSIFSEYGEVGRFKRGQFIRPVFLAAAAPSYALEVRYDYNLSEVLPPPSASPFLGDVWDSGIWDLALWGGTYVEIEKPQGGSGLGRAIAVALNGSSTTPTILIRYDLMYDTGGAL